METTVTIKIGEFPLCEHWHTALECRERAKSWENSELKSCLDIIFASLWEQAEEGKMEAVVAVRTGRPMHFYETLQKVMEGWGYQVEPPIYPYDNTYGCSKIWTFKW